jgi:hypothetical protein
MNRSRFVVRYAAARLALRLGWELVQLLLYTVWDYADAMPRVPPLGTGLAPLLQWLVAPPVALRLAGRRAP